MNMNAMLWIVYQ